MWTVPPPMLLREGVVGECLLDCCFHQLGGPGQAQATQLLDHSDSLLACRRDILAGMDRLKHGRDLPHLRRGHVAEDVAVPVHDAPPKRDIRSFSHEIFKLAVMGPMEVVVEAAGAKKIKEDL